MSPTYSLTSLVVIGIFLIFWVAAFVIFYHLTRFGVGVVPKRFSALFLSGSVILFCCAIILYQKVDLTKLFL